MPLSRIVSLLKRLGIEAEVKPKSKKILSERVAAVVVRGDAEITRRTSC